MPDFEYKVVPAPAKGEKAKGVKTPEARFAHALENVMNTLAQDGWEYLRSDMLPSEERSGLTGSTTNWRNVLVFRRVRPGSLEAFEPREVSAAQTSTAETMRQDPPLRAEPAPEPTQADTAAPPSGDTASITDALKARASASLAQSDASKDDEKA